MRNMLLGYLRKHDSVLASFYSVLSFFLRLFGLFIKIDRKRILFTSYGGRKYDDSPKAIYEEILNRSEFTNYKFIWAFVDVNAYSLPKGQKVKIDSPLFFYQLLKSGIWISNTGIDRDIGISKKDRISVETWHGTPLKKICGEENSNSKPCKRSKKDPIDSNTIRCAQSSYDRDIYARVFNASKQSIHLCDLPRNDALTKIYSDKQIDDIKNKIGIPTGKKVVLYMPTYREYTTDDLNQTFMQIPIDLKRWKSVLGEQYVLLVRAHYAVCRALNIIEDGFAYNVSDYSDIDELYLVSDMMISDYSSSYFDYSILCRPVFCYAYDLDEYKQKRGLYLEINEVLPCPIDKNEDDLLKDITTCDMKKRAEKVAEFRSVYAPNAGNATKYVLDTIIRQIKSGRMNGRENDKCSVKRR